MRDFGTYVQKRKAALRRRNIVCILCALVTLGAGWVLMRPAITLSDQPECGLEAHTHTEECYTQQIGPAPLVCTLEEHAHNDDCYDAEGNLLCQTQEHIHSEGCYGEPVSYPVLTCTIPEHTHTDDCCPIPEPTPAYTVAPELCCGMAEHTHGEGCYDGEDLICTVPEHIHTDICLVQQEPQQTEAAEQEPEQTEAAEQEPLTPLEELRQRLGIETEEDAAALDELLQAYGLTPEEILAGLAEMEADPEAEKIDSLEALQALLEAAAAVETLETEDGTLVPKTGGGYIGTVTVGDLTVTVDTASWQTGLDGCKLSVSATETETVKMDHGEVVVDKGIAVKIVNADGTDCTASVQCDGITITATEAMTESASPKIYYHENVELKEYGPWQKVNLSEDRKTLTTGKNFALPAEFLIDHWEPLTETYLDWPGASYSIGYILRKYNVFVQNDYTGSHVVGPVVAGYRFTPVWGLRGGFSGWQGKGCWVNPRQEYKFNYAQLNAEATFDIANCLGGFNHKRFFNPYLFAGIGVNMAFNNDDAVALNEAGNKLQYLWDDTKAFVAGRLGVGMDFRICDAVAFNLEGNANTLSDHFNSKKAGNADWQFNILAGVSIRFGKGYTRKTQKAAPTSIPPRNVPKEEPKEDPKPVVVPEKKTEKLQPIQVNVFFKINSAVIRPEEAGKVDELAAYLQKNPAAQVTLTGYADVQTGNHRLNKTLSARRAQAVADALTAKGIAADRITADSQGDTVQPFATPEENRVTICITADAPGM